MRDILWLIRKTVLSNFKSKKAVILYIFTPLLGFFIAYMSNAGNPDPTIKIGVVNEHQGYLSRDAVQFIKQMEHVTIVPVKISSLEKGIVSGNLDCGIMIKDGYTTKLMKGTSGEVDIASIKGASAASFITFYLDQYIQDISRIGTQTKNNPELFKKVYGKFKTSTLTVTAKPLSDAAGSRQITSQTVGYLLMMMLLSAGSLTEFILKEKENRTYFRLLSLIL